MRDKQGVFIFSDNEVINEGFLEDINNILTVGEIPNLYTKDDMAGYRDRVRNQYL